MALSKISSQKNFNFHYASEIHLALIIVVDGRFFLRLNPIQHARIRDNDDIFTLTINPPQRNKIVWDMNIKNFRSNRTTPNILIKTGPVFLINFRLSPPSLCHPAIFVASASSSPIIFYVLSSIGTFYIFLIKLLWM